MVERTVLLELARVYKLLQPGWTEDSTDGRIGQAGVDSGVHPKNGGEFLATSGELHWDAQPATLDNPKFGMHPDAQQFGMDPALRSAYFVVPSRLRLNQERDLLSAWVAPTRGRLLRGPMSVIVESRTEMPNAKRAKVYSLLLAVLYCAPGARYARRQQGRK